MLLKLMPKMEKNYEILQKRTCKFFLQVSSIRKMWKKNLRNHRINFGNETDAYFTTEFKVGALIFIMHYLQGPSSISVLCYQKIINNL